MKVYTVGIIGAGLQTRRRIPAILETGTTAIYGITSQGNKSAEKLSQQFSIKLFRNWQSLVNDKEVDIVLITTYPDTHAEIAIAASNKGKHVLCEKPLALTLDETKKIIAAVKKNNTILKCGFNHRFHPAILAAKDLVDKNTLGELLFGRGIYGHCGRPGFEKEWRSNKKYSAGGILMEQGIHLVDLYRWFFGDFHDVVSFTNTLYFPIHPFEDSAFVLFRNKKNQTVSIHSSNLQWKNMFVFEIYGTDGYIKIEGLGSSYGTEKLIIGKKKYSGPFEEEIKEFRGGDSSWKLEWLEFIDAIEKKREPLGNGKDGQEAIRLVLAAYISQQEKRIVTL